MHYGNIFLRRFILITFIYDLIQKNRSNIITVFVSTEEQFELLIFWLNPGFLNYLKLCKALWQFRYIKWVAKSNIDYTHKQKEITQISRYIQTFYMLSPKLCCSQIVPASYMWFQYFHFTAIWTSQAISEGSEVRWKINKTFRWRSRRGTNWK